MRTRRNPGFAGGTVTLNLGHRNITTNGTIDVHGANGTAKHRERIGRGTVNVVRSDTRLRVSVSIYGDILASEARPNAAGVGAYVGGPAAR